ncbi:hypothetical protein LMG29542_02306 [Paraburkholderia humisilvae]|uniref:Uncharacterized protein n=1 Tax=Paraburkholderia humisilvae TaxID=627669 RepID=A0A6J5DNC7_9BURK|nr:hypothetical protein LMG29542_02306 [Paraburkholderia humisilvae]
MKRDASTYPLDLGHELIDNSAGSVRANYGHERLFARTAA